MKKLFLLHILLISSLFLSAQYNSLGLYNPHFTFNKAELIPSKLGASSARFEMRLLPNLFVHQGNSLIGIEDILYPNTEAIDDALNNTDDFSVFGAGAEIPFLAFSYQFKKNEKELFTFSLSNKTRALGNILLGNNFLKLVWRGNKQFEGQTVDLGDFGATAFGATELNFGLAIPFKYKKDLALRVGTNLKYLISTGAVYLPQTSSSLTTGLDGRLIALEDLSYHIDLALPNEDAIITGSGLALDLGITMGLANNSNVSLAILDIGSLSYSTNTESYGFSSGDFNFEGIVLDDIFEAEEFEPDSLFFEDLRAEEDSNQTFSLPLPTRLVLQFEKNILSKTKKRGKQYIQHGFYLTYIQGFNNTAGAITKPYFSGAYSYSLRDIVNVGPTINYGGYGGIGVGMFFSVKAGAFKIGIGTNTGLSYLLFPDIAKRVDASFTSAWSFGGGNKKKLAEQEAEFTREKKKREKERKKEEEKAKKRKKKEQEKRGKS